MQVLGTEYIIIIPTFLYFSMFFPTSSAHQSVIFSPVRSYSSRYKITSDAKLLITNIMFLYDICLFLLSTVIIYLNLHLTGGRNHPVFMLSCSSCSRFHETVGLNYQIGVILRTRSQHTHRHITTDTYIHTYTVTLEIIL